MRVIVKRPRETAKVVDIDGSLQSLQDLVGGNIEMVSGVILGLPPGVDVYVNEEGKLLDLFPNLALRSQGKVFDVVLGTAVYASHDDVGEVIDMHEELHPFVQEHARANGL